MKYLTVKGQRLPAVGLGTSQLSGRACADAVGTGLRLGYRHIDTAQAYGNEADVGRAIAQSGVPREDLFLTTKVWLSSLDARGVQRSTAESLKRLRTDYVDLLLVHWPNDSVPMGETLAAFAELKAQGRTRAIGVSNYTPRHLKEAVEVHKADLLCEQAEFHVQLDQARLLELVRGYGLAFVAYSPLGRGRIPDDPTLTAIGRQYGKSASQVALAWLLRNDGVAVIPKASSEAHLRANLEVFDFELSAEDIGRIAGLNTRSRVWEPSWGPRWED